MENDNDENILEHLIDTLINNQPLTSPRIEEFSEAIRINQQITNNISNIRRFLENDIENDIYNNTMFNTMFNRMFNNIFDDNIHLNESNENLSNGNETNELVGNVSTENVHNENESSENEYDDNLPYIELNNNYTDTVLNDNQYYNRLVNEIYNNTNINRYYSDNDNNIDYTSIVNEIYNNNNSIITRNNSESNYINTLFNIDFSTDSSLLNRIMHSFLDPSMIHINDNTFEDVKVTLTKEQFKKLDNQIISEENTDNKQCNICMDEYKIGDKIINLDCTHIFHRRCIKHWLLQEKVTCPVCRKDVREMIK